MIGKRKVQATLFDVGNVWAFAPKANSFHGQLCKVSDKLFKDEEFMALYSERMGRPSVPPSELALLMILQSYERLSDEEAIEHTACDLRWAAILRRHAGQPLCAKSTLQLFRAQLILHDKLNILLEKSLLQARENSLISSDALKAVLDTKPILGHGAVQDTYNLLAEGMRQLTRAISAKEGIAIKKLLKREGLGRLGASSIKGTAKIDWSNKEERERFLGILVAEARKLLQLAEGLGSEVKESASLLEKLLLQDVQESPVAGEITATIKEGTVKDRIPSATDPEQRHGRKSASKRFVGSKASIATDSEHGLILAVEVLPGNAGDAEGALELVAAAEQNAGAPIKEVVGDCAYGSGDTRQAFADAGRTLTAKIPSQPAKGGLYPKSSFVVMLPSEGNSLEEARVTCPAGHTAGYLSAHANGSVTFYFDEHCEGCPLRSACTTSKIGRSIHLSAHERLMHQAKARACTEEGKAALSGRWIVENTLARLARLGIGQARYFGRNKTRMQLSVAAAVVNLRRVWNLTASAGCLQMAG